MDNFSNIKSSFILPLQIFCLVLLFSFNAISVPPFGAVEINDKTQWLEGASLKTDSTVDELMARAKQFSDQGRYDLASSLWQKVIDSSNDLVFGSDEWLEKTLSHEYQIYRSVSREIESTLSQLPKNGLEGYRLDADTKAKIIFSSYDVEEGRESALAEVVNRFFLSSFGDDAAFELACLKLDRYEFLPSIRLIDKILNDYPDTDINRSELLIRAAVLSARVGDLARARQLLEELKTLPGLNVSQSLIEIIERDISNSELNTNDQNFVDMWTMAMGNAQRSGLMKVPVDLPADEGNISWIQKYDLTLPEGWPPLPSVKDKPDLLNLTDPFGRRIGGSSAVAGNKALTIEQITKTWEKENWMPCGQILFGPNYLYFKNEDRLVCVDSSKGIVKWLGFRTQYPQPRFSNNYRFRRPTSQDAKKIPRDIKEIQYFSDHANQSMCLVGDKLITIQGVPLDFTEEEIPIDQNPENDIQRGVWPNRLNGGTSRMRKNRLVAYHSINGKLQWMRPALEKKDGPFADSCFIGDPVPYGNLVLVPILEGTGMYLIALNPDSGYTQWKTFLGDEPESGIAPNSSVMVAIAGGEAYVATGTGLAFSLDAISGSLNWVVRYPRTVKNNASRLQELQRFGGFARGNMGMPDFDGWDIDTVIPSKRVVVFAPTDFNQLIALDRRTGKLIWETARVPLRGGNESSYVLGLLDERLFIGGGGVVRCYDVSGGKMLWENTFPKGYGRGALTQEDIFIPSGKKDIIKISNIDGAIKDQITVIPKDEQPLGNIFSNGKNIIVMGLRQVFSVTEKLQKKEESNEKNNREEIK